MAVRGRGVPLRTAVARLFDEESPSTRVCSKVAQTRGA